MSTIDIPLRAADLPTITLRASGVRVLSARFHIANYLVGLARRVLQGRLALVEDQPPVTSYDVGVEKVGGDMMLRIGDRAVRLPNADARHIGALLESGWPGTVYGMRAHGFPPRL